MKVMCVERYTNGERLVVEMPKSLVNDYKSLKPYIHEMKISLPDPNAAGLFNPGDMVQIDISLIPKLPLPEEEDNEPTTAD